MVYVKVKRSHLQAAAALIAVIAGLHVGVFAYKWYNDPLTVLERAARRHVYISSHYDPPIGDDAKWDAKRVEAILVNWLGAHLIYEEPNDAYYGLTDYTHRVIHIDSSLNWDARIEVLAHEGGHLLAPGNLDGDEAEVFAEAVSYLVTTHFGLYDLPNYASYCTAHKSGLRVLTDYRQEIQTAARILTGE